MTKRMPSNSLLMCDYSVSSIHIFFNKENLKIYSSFFIALIREYHRFNVYVIQKV